MDLCFARCEASLGTASVGSRVGLDTYDGSAAPTGGLCGLRQSFRNVQARKVLASLSLAASLTARRCPIGAGISSRLSETEALDRIHTRGTTRRCDDPEAPPDTSL